MHVQQIQVFLLLNFFYIHYIQSEVSIGLQCLILQYSVYNIN